ncbi:hypothetical protein M422DRAFT_262418 [Sphaerobolus stellatus SS14]|uniref:Carboxylic ester hydrolase n=1 Tax=Sphaerobolus stellatus (strain SS14) TaxID=990650 RepID=A0A0C9UK51_SPHS4|nr:hypothetical protein M422DRAFT_262418 [Sphaerobolus stellatus SS14]
MKFTRLALFAPILFAKFSTAAGPVPSAPVINLGYVNLLGNTTSPTGTPSTTVQFFGKIPYAQAPTGSLRFRAPQPLNETARPNPPILDARNFGPECIQQPATAGVGSEDCLFINVWKPAKAKEGDKLPVIVWIYGGGFVAGDAAGYPMYDWVNQTQDVIAVSLGYRLNMFGFLVSPSMDPADLNAGLLDQRAALEWVQRHISKFGGDPNTVTIDGESAGGAATVMQIVAFGGEKPVPFIRAISQSIGYGPMPTTEQSAQAFLNATIATNCPATGQASLDCLRAASLTSLIQADNIVPPGKFSPTVSGPGTILPDSPANLIRKGKFAFVEYIAGHCTNDGTTFTSGTPATVLTTADFVANLLDRWPSLSNATINKAIELYPAPNATGSPFTTEYDRTWTAEQDAVFGCMDMFLANKTATLSGKKTFTFRFNSPNPLSGVASSPWLGVGHGSDVYFLFGGSFGVAGLGVQLNSTELALSKEIIAYWTSFARSGNPSTFKESYSPNWVEWQGTGKRVVMTRGNSPDGTASTLESVSSFEKERCTFWMSEDVTRETLL